MARRRGLGSVYRPKTKGRDGTVYVSKTYWMRYWSGNGQVRESTNKQTHKEALEVLKEKVSALQKQPRVAGLSVSDLLHMVEDDYALNKRKSLGSIKRSRLPHVKPYFGHMLASDVTNDTIETYQAFRQKQGASNASINRECALLRRGFQLAVRRGKLRTRPEFVRLTESAPRKGFWTEELLDEYCSTFPEHHKRILPIGFITGWRVNEILSRQKSDVDLVAGELRLEVGEGKDQNEGRVFPLVPSLKKILKEQLAYVASVEKKIGREVKWLFCRPNGAQVRDFRSSLEKGRAATGTHRIFHDFRRTAVRNLEQAGVPRKAAMAMVGHKTESMYSRYNIADRKMIQAGAEKYGKFLGRKKKAS